MTFQQNQIKSDANHCQTKFTWRINHKQFRCHSYPESCKAHCPKNEFFGKRFLKPTLHLLLICAVIPKRVLHSQRDCLNCATPSLQKCHTVVAKMPHRYLERVSRLFQLDYLSHRQRYEFSLKIHPSCALVRLGRYFFPKRP